MRVQSMVQALLSSAAFVMITQPVQAQTADPLRQITFTGVVSYRIDDTVQLRNPDGSLVNFDASAFGAVGPAAGEKISLTYSYSANDPAFSNAACGGTYSLNSAQRAGGCTVATTVRLTDGSGALSGTGFGGTGGDSPPFISGLTLQVDPVSGETTIDLPTGEYRLGYASVPNYQYDSASGALTGVGDPCISAFNCADDTGIGTADRLSFALDVTGDYGKVRPGFDVGYRAGVAGFLDLLGSFSIGAGSSGGGVQVPEPGSSVLFALGLGAIITRRKRRAAVKAA